MPQSIPDILVTNDLRKGVSFQKKMFFQNVYDEGFSPLSPLSRDDQGLPGLGEGLGDGSASLGVSRRIVPSYKDQFVIFHYLYSW